MNKDIVLLDLFSGIGGFHAGLTRAGFNITKSYTSEIDKHAIAIYKYHFKNSEYVGDVTALDGRSITRPNIITFGSPCQDFSVAGKRAGMAGERSSLIREAIRLITECRPDVFIWENVKGVFSSNDGRDFWAVIQAFTNIGGYRLEWQLLNTSWFLPQNRERIYLVGHLIGSSRGSREVFPIEKDGGLNDEVQQKEAERGIRASCIGTRYGQKWTDETYIVAQRGRENGQELEIQKEDKTNTITGVQKDNLLVCDWRDDEGLRIRKDGNAPTINARAREDKCGVPMVISHYGHKDKSPQESEVVPTLKAESHGHEPMTIANAVTPDAYLAREERNRDENGKAILTSMHERRIRRLTPIECERLQGFPDNWTEYGDYDGEIKRVADTQRYKTLGNAVTVRVVAEVGRRLLKL